jgi:hypothetical protein
VSSEGSTDSDGSACGDAEICVVPAALSFVAVGLRGFLAMVASRPVWRLAVFFVAAGTPDSGDG